MVRLHAQKTSACVTILGSRMRGRLIQRCAYAPLTVSSWVSPALFAKGKRVTLMGCLLNVKRVGHMTFQVLELKCLTRVVLNLDVLVAVVLLLPRARLLAHPRVVGHPRSPDATGSA